MSENIIQNTLSYIPRGEANEDELLEEFGAADGRKDADHGREWVGDQRAALYTQRVKDSKQIVDVRIKGHVPAEVEVVGIDAPGAGQIVEDDAVVALQERHDLVPDRLVGAEAVGEDEDLAAGSDDPDVQDLQQAASVAAAIANHLLLGFGSGSWYELVLLKGGGYIVGG